MYKVQSITLFGDFMIRFLNVFGNTFVVYFQIVSFYSLTKILI